MQRFTERRIAGKIRTQDERFAAVAEEILDRVEADPASFATPGYSVGEFLAEALAYPDITAVLPGPLQPLTDYTRFFRGSQLVRIRRDDTTASIFGGTDWHNNRQDSGGNRTTIREIASGLSTKPDVLQASQGHGDLGLRPDVTTLLQHRPLPQ